MAEVPLPTTADNDETTGQTVEYVDMSGKHGRLGPVYDSPHASRRPVFAPMMARRPERESLELEEIVEGNKYLSLFASKLDPIIPPAPPAMRSPTETENITESDIDGEGGEYLSPVPALPLAPPRPSPSPFHTVQSTVIKATVTIILFQFIVAANIIFLNDHFNAARASTQAGNNNETMLIHMDQFVSKFNALERRLFTNLQAIGQRTNRKLVTFTRMRSRQFADQRKNMTETFKRFDRILSDHADNMIHGLWKLVNVTVQVVHEARAIG